MTVAKSGGTSVAVEEYVECNCSEVSISEDVSDGVSFSMKSKMCRVG